MVGRPWLLPLIIGICVLFSADLSLQLTRHADRIAAIWVFNAVVLAALLRTPLKAWDMAGAGRRCRNGGVNVLKANTLPLACGFTVRNVVEALICAAPLRLLARRDETLDLARPRHLATFIVMALGPASLCSATLAATLFATLAHVSFQRILFQWYAPMRLGF